MSITNTITTHPLRFSLIISILMCLLFWSSTPRVNVGYGDSDEFLTVGQTWGLAHPPGYSTYTTILHLATKIAIPGTTETLRMHAVSGILAATTIYAILILLFEINIANLLGKKKNNNLIKVVAITMIALGLGTAKLFWLYAQIAEKYIFSAPFVAILFLIGYRLMFRPTVKLKTIALFGLLFGFLVSHHQSMVFLLPFFGYVIVNVPTSTKIRCLAIGLAFTLIGFLAPLGLTLIQQSRHVQPSWHMDTGLPGLIKFVTRKDFQGTLYQTNTSTSGYTPNQLTLNQFTSGTTHYLDTFFTTTSWWMLLPLIMSGILLFKKNRKTLLFFSLPPLLLGICLAIYLNWPSDLGSQAITVRFYLPSLLTWAPLLFLGLYEILFRLHRFMILIGTSKQISLIVISIFLLIPLTRIPSSYRQVSLKDFDLISRLYGKIITDVKPNSLITCYSDSSCFALLYEKTVNHKRPDVDIVPLAFPLVKSTINSKQLAGFTYTSNPYLMMDVVTWNIDLRPVYAADISQYYYSFFGFDRGFLSYNPRGYIAEISRSMPAQLFPYPYQLSEEYIHKQIPSFDLMRRFLVQSLSNIHFTNGYAWLKIGDRPQAQKEFSLAVNLAYQLTASEKATAIGTRTEVEKTQPSRLYAPGSKTQTSTQLISYLPDLFKQNFNSQAFSVARGAVMANPRDVAARLELARIFQKMGDTGFTQREYQHVLILDPQNQEALQAIANLSP